jgi:TrmH family RNA methyltransferase
MQPLWDHLRVVLVSPRNPLNIGAAARAMSNFGFRHLRLVAPYDLAFREARSAVNAAAVLESAEVFPTLPEAVADCTLVAGTSSLGPREPKHVVHRLEHAAPLLRAEAAANPLALVFGSEKFGLGNEDLSYCHCLLRIPTREEHGSMNLGQAVALCLYELIRDPEAPVLTPTAARRAEAADLHRLTERMLEVLRRSGYINPRTESIEDKIRRLVWRLDLSAQDVEIWLGIFRQVQWKLDREAGQQ